MLYIKPIIPYLLTAIISSTTFLILNKIQISAGLYSCHQPFFGSIGCLETALLLTVVKIIVLGFISALLLRYLKIKNTYFVAAFAVVEAFIVNAAIIWIAFGLMYYLLLTVIFIISFLAAHFLFNYLQLKLRYRLIIAVLFIILTIYFVSQLIAY